jgi:hypothetical protein
MFSNEKIIFCCNEETKRRERNINFETDGDKRLIERLYADKGKIISSIKDGIWNN